jgi:deferrochelatase/peroxidase EfeB
MLRRGIPYGPPLPEGETDDQDRGLVFIALVGDLRRQFEFVQANWMSDGNSFRLGSDRDVISGAAPSPKMTVQGEHPVFLPTPAPLVTCTGGDYFFLPSLTTLSSLLN